MLNPWVEISTQRPPWIGERCEKCGEAWTNSNTRTRCTNCYHRWYQLPDGKKFRGKTEPRKRREPLNGLIHPLRPYTLMLFSAKGRMHPMYRQYVGVLKVILTDGITVPLGTHPTNKGFKKLMWQSAAVGAHNFLENYNYAISLCDFYNLRHQLRRGAVGISEARLRATTNSWQKRQLVEAIMLGRLV